METERSPVRIRPRGLSLILDLSLKTIGKNLAETKESLNTEDFEINPLLNELRENPVAGKGETHYFVSFDNTKIFYRIWKPPNKVQKIIIVSHGMGGHGEFFVLLADKLVSEGIMVVAPDYRNHGRSDGKKGDLKKFKYILQDLKVFFNYISSQFPNIPIFLLGESMGGAVNANYVADHPENVSGLILFSPAVKLNFNWAMKLGLGLAMLPFLVLRVCCPSAKLIPAKGREEQGIANPIHQQYDKTDPYHLDMVSIRYLLQLFKYIRKSIKKAKKISIPTLIFQGTEDPGVSPEGVAEFYEKLESIDKKLFLIEGGYHCLITDPLFRDKWHYLIDWLKSH
jgi:acylglycerol lipase